MADAPFGFESGTTLKIRLKFESGLAEHVIGRFRLAFTTAKAPSLNLVPPPKIAALLETPEASGPRPRRRRSGTYYRGTLSAEIQPFRDELAALRKAEGAIDRAIPTTMVMKEQEKPRETHILMRGDFRSKGEVVTPDVPQSLPRIPDGQPANRLGLARWLVDPGHPLVARVTVNRFWQHYFGVGPGQDERRLRDAGGVAQPPRTARLAGHRVHRERLGRQGAPEADRHVRHLSPELAGWTPTRLERDPENRLLARGPRFRLDAETIRDNALAVSGLLDPQDGRAEHLPVPAPGALGRAGVRRRLQQPDLHDQQGRGPLPPRPLHLLEAVRCRTPR